MKKKHLIMLSIAAIAAVAAGIYLFGSSPTHPTPVQDDEDKVEPVGPQFLADSAYAYCEAQCAFGPRVMNSEAHEKCAEWIAAKFRQFGCDVELQKADLKGYDGPPTSSPATTPRPRDASSSAHTGTADPGPTTTPTRSTGASPSWQPTTEHPAWPSCSNWHASSPLSREG